MLAGIARWLGRTFGPAQHQLDTINTVVRDLEAVRSSATLFVVKALLAKSTLPDETRVGGINNFCSVYAMIMVANLPNLHITITVANDPFIREQVRRWLESPQICAEYIGETDEGFTCVVDITDTLVRDYVRTR